MAESSLSLFNDDYSESSASDSVRSHSRLRFHHLQDVYRNSLRTLMPFLNRDVQGFTDYDDADSELECNTDSIDPDPIPDCEGIGLHGWSGIPLVAKHDDGSIFADVLIVNVDPNTCVDGHRVLGDDNVGIVVLQVENGDVALEDSLMPWPKRQLFHIAAGAEVSVYDHARKRSALDEASSGGRRAPGKRRYRYENRSCAIRSEDKRKALLSEESVSRVYIQRCCTRSCTRKFGVEVVRALRTEMHLQSFQLKSMKNLEVHRAIHDAHGSNSKVITVEGKDICLKAWRIIHNVSLRTFQRYAMRAKRQERGAPHGNSSTSKTRSGSIQAVETLRALLEAKADHMPHMQCTLRSGERVGMKVLPAGTRWNHFLPIVNQVTFHWDDPTDKFSHVRSIGGQFLISMHMISMVSCICILCGVRTYSIGILQIFSYSFLCCREFETSTLQIFKEMHSQVCK